MWFENKAREYHRRFGLSDLFDWHLRIRSAHVTIVYADNSEVTSVHTTAGI
jgi:hypothetical protein